MDIIIGILAFVFVLGVIIVIHEAGHFFFARRVNILCRDFAFGMGPILWKKKKGETLYSIRLFPIGGFCAIAGEELEDDPLKGENHVRVEIVNGIVKKIYVDQKHQAFKDIPEYKLIRYDIFDANETGKLYMVLDQGQGEVEYPVDPQAMMVFAHQEMQIAPYNRTLGSKRKRDRAMVMFGGPLANFLLALVVFFIAGLLQGFPVKNSSVLDTIDEGVPAYTILQKDDKITHLASGTITKDITKWSDVSSFMDEYTRNYPSEYIIVDYERDGKGYQVLIRPQVIIYTAGIASDYTKSGVIVKNDVNDVIKAGSEIIKVNDQAVSNWYDVYSVFMNNKEGLLVKLTIKDPSGVEKTSTIKPYSENVWSKQKTLFGDSLPMVKVALGISQETKFSLLQSFAYSGKMAASSFGLVFNTLDLLFTSKEVGVKDLSGPLGIFEMSKNVATTSGFVGLLNLIGLLSVNVGLLNLLPIPALDGGRLVFLGYEAITKKKPNQKVETALIAVTMILLFGLMIYVFYNDLLRLIGVK